MLTSAGVTKWRSDRFSCLNFSYVLDLGEPCNVSTQMILKLTV